MRGLTYRLRRRAAQVNRSFSGVAGADIWLPLLQSALIQADGETLVLSFNEPVTGNAGFSLTASGGAVAPTHDSGTGIHELTYALDRVVEVGETVTLDYTPGDVADIAENALAAFASFPVNNESEQVGE